MQALYPVAAAVLILAACAPAVPSARHGGAAASQLSAAQKSAIGRKIWQNECGGTVPGLTSWNAGEEFPSLGIGHFIWYPAGVKGRFKESWPQFVAFAKQQGITPPPVALELASPWRTKAEFQKDFNQPRLTTLRQWLADTVGVQTDFIIARSRVALPTMLATAPIGERSRIEANYRKVGTSPNGTYALIDYVNSLYHIIRWFLWRDGMAWRSLIMPSFLHSLDFQSWTESRRR